LRETTWKGKGRKTRNGVWGWERLGRTVEKGKERMAEKVKESKDKERKKYRVGKGVRDNNKFLYRPRKEENEEGKNWKIKGSKEERKGRGICRYKKLFK
jgi:hypothetical protein